ncbi:endonuclease [Oceanospirillum phage vB_OsaM_PD0307]|nr:endonuclease [Oceanospirillum phage vB_OsaM_PD0307]
MTRINVVPPAELVNKHLMAEYRELPRIFTDVRKRVAKGQQPADIQQPDRYKLGAGHCLFFVTRCGWLLERYQQLCGELLERGYNLNLELFNDICDAAELLPSQWCGAYQPDADAMQINRQRIKERLQ